jgi:hypothetical protein
MYGCVLGVCEGCCSKKKQEKEFFHRFETILSVSRRKGRFSSGASVGVKNLQTILIP